MSIPTTDLQLPEGALGRFGHHPDPAIDFEVEVESLEGEVINFIAGFANGTPSREELETRIFRAMSFRVGGDVGAVAAKQILRQTERKFLAHIAIDAAGGSK